jgi:thiol-disulfide isomerase/thioredoxin
MESITLNNLKWLLIFVLTLVVTNANAMSKLEIGDVPPSYIGKDTEGIEVNLEDNKGKIIIISFWASWCSPCLKELPILEEIQTTLGKSRIKVIAVNFKESRKQFRNIKKQLSTLALTLTHDKRGSLGNKFGVKGIPHLFIVGKSGELIYQSVGYGDSSRARIVKIVNKELSS